jgi:hypothetical protein
MATIRGLARQRQTVSECDLKPENLMSLMLRDLYNYLLGKVLECSNSETIQKTVTSNYKSETDQD